MAEHSQQARRFRDDGYVVVRGWLDAPRTETLRSAVERADDDGEDNPLSLSTMQFRSNLYRHSAELCAFLVDDRLIDLLTALGGPDLWIRWDQAVWKGPGAPEFPWHQDNGYTELDAEHLQVWVALTDMDEHNGGLELWPGGHRRRLVHRWVGNHVVADPAVVGGSPLLVDAAAGDLVVFSSWTPHRTTPNRTSGTRLAYVAEYLPLTTADWSVPPPHLVAAEGARAVGRWRDLRPAWT